MIDYNIITNSINTATEPFLCFYTVDGIKIIPLSSTDTLIDNVITLNDYVAGYTLDDEMKTYIPEILATVYTVIGEIFLITK